MRAADGYQTGGRVRFSAQGWEQTVYLDRGVASVTLPGTLRGGVESVKAEYLGFDFLTASPEAEQATVLQTNTPVGGTVGGSVPATLSLTLGAPVAFGAFTPGLAKDYTASTTATVTSTAGDATLSTSTARLTNGAFSLAQPVVITPAKTSWSGPVSQRRRHDRLQAVDRRDRTAAHRRLQRERHVHAVHDHPVTAAAGAQAPAVLLDCSVRMVIQLFHLRGGQ